MEATTEYYVKYKTRFGRGGYPFLLNNCINYITQSRTGVSVNEALMPQSIQPPIYEVIVTHGGTRFKIVRMDVYPPRTIATFKPKLYVKSKAGFRPFASEIENIF